MLTFMFTWVGLVSSVNRASAWCQMTSSGLEATTEMPCVIEGVPLSWRTGCMAYAVDHRGGIDISASELEGALDNSFRAWMNVTCDGLSPGFDVRGYTERAVCQDAEFRGDDGNVNVVAMVNDWDERDYDSEAFAITTVWHNTRSGEILDVDILINEQLGPYAICPATGCPPALPRDQVVDLENVLTHEVGHFFGIAHSDVPNATMYFQAGRGETIKRTLAADDEEALCTIYAPGTLAACDDFTPRGGLDLNCELEPQGSSCSANPARSPLGANAPEVWLFLLGCGALAVRKRRQPRQNR